MLTRLEIDGFKSFDQFAVDLRPFTVVLGSNAAGKSNLFDAIRLLSLLATRDVAEAIKDMRGEPLELFRTTAAGRSERIRLAVEVLVDPVVRDPWGSEVRLSHTRLRYELTLERREIRPGVSRIHVASEAAHPILRKEDQWSRDMQPSKAFRDGYLKYARQKPFLTTELASEGLSFSIHQDGKAGRNRPASAAEATVLYSITNAEFPHLFALREEMRFWRLLQLDPALLRRPVPVTAPDVLSPDGANLAAVLAQLKAETASAERPQGVLSDIALELGQLIPGVTALDVGLDGASREYRFELTMRDGQAFSSRVVSDGTLRILALLTLLHDPRHRGLICFEEPENGVHPGRVRELVQRLRAMVTDPGLESGNDTPLSQLLLNSHSPVVLAALIDSQMHPVDGAVLFADTATLVDPVRHQLQRRTRLRPVATAAQSKLFEDGNVSELEVRMMLETARAEG